MSVSRLPRPRAASLRLLLGVVISIFAITTLASAAGAQAPADGKPVEASVLAEIRAGDSLESALERLQRAGVPVVYTSQLVREEMRVRRAPRPMPARPLLEALLAPHGLGVRDGPAGRLLVVPAPDGSERDGSEAATEEGAAPDDPSSRPTTRETIDVVASRPWILGETPSALALERRDLLALPHVGDDVFRSLALLPGTTHSDSSAKLSVRGGRDDELLVRLDDVEIVEPYHLQDFGGALGILAPPIIGRVELLTGGFPAEFGDRMSGVLEIETLSPSWSRRRELALSLLSGDFASSGRSDDGRLAYLGSARGGSLEIPFRFADQEERPSFWDAFGKVDWRRGKNDYGVTALISGDRLRFGEEELAGDGSESIERFDTQYRSTYLWFTHQHLSSPRLFADTRLIGSRIERDRRGFRDAGDLDFELEDLRDARTFTLAQDWHWQIAEEGLFDRLRWGVDLRRLDVDYDYRNDRQANGELSLVREDGASGTTSFDRRFVGEHVSGWSSLRLRPRPGLTVEAGLRFDRNTVLSDDYVWSPRLSARWARSPRHLFHAAAGRFTQSQRLYELQVEDGVTRFTRSEKASYWSLGYEHVFAGAGRPARRPLTLRAEIYQRRVGSPRVRFENLYEPISKVPEIEADRLRVAPERSLARGFELFFGGAAGRRFDFFVTYTWSRTEDRLDDGFGLREVPRQRDQPHSLRFDLAWHAPRGFEVQAAWHSRSGWPTTALDARLVEGAGGEPVIEPVLGPLRGERLPEYHRLDLRLARVFDLSRGELDAYIEVQNVFNRRNVRGYEIAFGPRAEDGEVDVLFDETSWGRIFPSFGVRWRF